MVSPGAGPLSSDTDVSSQAGVMTGRPGSSGFGVHTARAIHTSGRALVSSTPDSAPIGSATILPVGSAPPDPIAVSFPAVGSAFSLNIFNGRPSSIRPRPVRHRIEDCRMRSGPGDWWIACLCGSRLIANSDDDLQALWGAHGGRGSRTW